ncbi:MAG: aspartyl protease family protein [Candidatus Eremiobacteraeota bacterium]|nr:aspartyl protease family protein [Candidatus Eremiobacteraeota bacterium]
MFSLICALAVTGTPPASSAAQLFAQGDFIRAKVAYADAASRNPADPEAILGLARIELYENDLDAAAKDAKMVLSLKADDETAKAVLRTVEQRRNILTSADGLGVPDSGIVVPFVESEPLPAIQLEIAGKPATLVLDTGAPDVTLDPDFAKALGLAITGGSQGAFLGGRTAVVRQAVVSSIVVGPIALTNVKVTILPSRGFGLFKDRTVDGIVGTPFLSRFLSTIDYPHHRLLLRPRRAVMANAGGTAVPMWLVGDHFIFAAGKVNGLTNQLFSIDTGGAGAGFVPVQATIAAAHIKTFPDKAMQGMGGGGPVTIVPTLADELCLGPVCQKNVGGGYTPSGSPLSMFPFAVSGTVSHSFLERYAVTFDFTHMRLLMT